jgi:hypothetical protein
VSRIVISSRFCGPPKSGNGGYVCGRLAAAIGGAASVRLMAPPPLETELRIERSNGWAKLLHGSSVIAEAKPAAVDLAPPRVPTYAQAESAARNYLGFARHPFPRCFVCGPERGAGDGLRIFPGSLATDGLVAAPWTPARSLANGSDAIGREFLWAALDCTSGFAVLPIREGKAIVLGELSARIDGEVVPGDPCVVVGWPLRVEGRKRYSAAAVLRDTGDLLAVGCATWIEVPASAFGASTGASGAASATAAYRPGA